MKFIGILALRSFLISLTIIGAQHLWEMVFKTNEFKYSLPSFAVLLLVGFGLSLSWKWFQAR